MHEYVLVQLIGRFGHCNNFVTGRFPSGFNIFHTEKMHPQVRLRGMTSVKCQSIKWIIPIS